MISCTECNNNGYCIFWKAEKIDMRAVFECRGSINYCQQLATIVNHGEYIAKHCEKFQKMI